MTEPSVPDHFSELMRAVQAGDGDSYAHLLNEITPRIRRVVRSHRSFLQAEDIEDLVQEILLSIHAVRGTYDPQRPFVPWLMSITRNRLADGARRYSRSAAHEIQIENLAVTFADESTNTNMDEYGDVEELRQAIATLPPIQRDAIQMLKLREMSLKEAAAASHTTVGALKVATHRAMAALRKMLVKQK